MSMSTGKVVQVVGPVVADLVRQQPRDAVVHARIVQVGLHHPAVVREVLRVQAIAHREVGRDAGDDRHHQAPAGRVARQR